MPEIVVQPVSATGQRSVFKITIRDEGSSTEHIVEIDDAYYRKLTGGTEKPEDLLVRSFKFLLQREPKEMILHRFNLSKISSYFPEYENEIKRV